MINFRAMKTVNVLYNHVIIVNLVDAYQNFRDPSVTKLHDFYGPGKKTGCRGAWQGVDPRGIEWLIPYYIIMLCEFSRIINMWRGV